MSPDLFAPTGVFLFGVGTQTFCGIRTHQAVHQILGIVGNIVNVIIL
jgi:hypothetical protein